MPPPTFWHRCFPVNFAKFLKTPFLTEYLWWLFCLQNKIEKVQYRACLAITGGIQGTSRERLHDELGLHSLVKRRWRNLQNSKSFATRLPLLLSRFLFSRKLSIKIIINLYYKASSNKNKILQKNIFPYRINE